MLAFIFLLLPMTRLGAQDGDGAERLTKIQVTDPLLAQELGYLFYLILAFNAAYPQAVTGLVQLG